MIDALDTLYIMELEEEFQEAKQWVERSFDLNVVSESAVGVLLCCQPWSVSPSSSGGRSH